MTTSILLRSSPSSSPSPASTPLPTLQADLSSSSSSSSGSWLDLRRSSSAPSTRRIRFAPLPDPRRDLFYSNDPYDHPQPDPKPPTGFLPRPADNDNGLVPLSPSVSSDSTVSSARSTPTNQIPPNTSSKNVPKSSSKLLRSFAFFRRSHSSTSSNSSLFQSASLPSSRNPSLSSLNPSPSSILNSPPFRSTRLPRFSTEDILPFGTKSLFGARQGSPTTRPLSPPPKPSDSTKSLHRSASTGSGPGMKLGNARRGQSNDFTSIAGSGTRKRRASSSALTPGAGGGRHASSVKMAPNDSPARSSTLSTSSIPPRKRHVKMLNGRVYGAKRYAAQTLANPFASARDEPEFVEWGYGGMGSVHASVGIANDMWKGLQRSERGSALLAGSSFDLPSASTPGATIAGGGRGSGARPTSATARRKMSDDVPECGMGNVSSGGGLDDDDGSGMGWVKRRRAEKEAKLRLEQEAKELEKKPQERRKSSDSIDASMYASTASTSTLTACTSAASTNLTTPFTSRSPSVTDLAWTSSPSSECPDLCAGPPRTESIEQSSRSDTSPVHPAPASRGEHEHHVLTAVRLSPNISASSHKHSHSVPHGRSPSLSHTLSQLGTDTGDEGAEQVPLSPVDAETSAGTHSNDEDEEGQSQGSDEEDDVDDEDDKAQDIRRKTALGAGVEKISRYVDVEAR